ncbi:MAG: glycosyltransferase family 2 protein [Candidatus Roizmanbacteria bacterium]|nr:glycosyltransferase family 2 protein [Candidatus Roizmanbacteria bacterium]
MTVSVILPAYNEEKYIEKCIQSILNQSIPPEEVIVVDNNSTDKTVEIAKKYPVKIVLEKTQGIIATRNHGFDLATSDIIARTDADSEVPYTWIEQIKTYMDTNKCDALLGASYYNMSPPPINDTLFLSFAEAIKKIFGVYPLIGPNMAITQSAWKKVKPLLCMNEKEIHEDVDIALHMKKLGATICFDRSNIVWTSTRRLVQKPHSFFLEYPHRLIRMRQTHL